MSAGWRSILIGGLALLLVAACGGPIPTATPAPTPTPVPPDGEKVTFVTEDGVTLAGTLYPGGGDLAVVLAHQGVGQTTQSSWRAFAEVAAINGITAFPFNFRRDFCGPLDQGVLAAIRYLRSRGYTRIACVGASMGGTSCLKAALTEELLGVGAIGSNWSTGGGVSLSREELASLAMPKLFVTTDKDRFPAVPVSMKEMYAQAPDPKQFQEYSGSAQGTEIFSTQHRDELRTLLFEFLEQLR
jgi:hypothetical protein